MSKPTSKYKSLYLLVGLDIKSRYLFLDKGHVAKNLKQSKDCV